eukprot:TRINITY_DN6377_c0_g1_i3.p2 TRINITY_DN6377_c0_g1~~TRINITY_DN6377_c0_g1_i3.p2  ORF type:complete len:142 (-),score=5.59 TRINITY_DN6377_c0_g1_i3:486-911(-)
MNTFFTRISTVLSKLEERYKGPMPKLYVALSALIKSFGAFTILFHRSVMIFPFIYFQCYTVKADTYFKDPKVMRTLILRGFLDFSLSDLVTQRYILLSSQKQFRLCKQLQCGLQFFLYFLLVKSLLLMSFSILYCVFLEFF